MQQGLEPTAWRMGVVNGQSPVLSHRKRNFGSWKCLSPCGGWAVSSPTTPSSEPGVFPTRGRAGVRVGGGSRPGALPSRRTQALSSDLLRGANSASGAHPGGLSGTAASSGRPSPPTPAPRPYSGRAPRRRQHRWWRRLGCTPPCPRVPGVGAAR